MKKVLTIIILTITLLVNQTILVSSQENLVDDKLMYDTIITMLYPYINDEIINYYGYRKSYDLYNAEIKEISKINGYRFNVKIHVKTFEHAHNPPYGNETITFDISLSEIKPIDFKHQGDKYKKIIDQFYNKTLLDIKQSFSLNLDDYKEYKFNQFYHLAYTQETYSSLYKIVEDIILNKLQYNTKSGYKNVIKPVVYLKEKNGYILYKLSDGTNILYKIEKEDEIWRIKEKLSKQGKKMEYKLKWYM